MNAANTSTAAGGTFSRDLLASVVVFLVALPLCMGIAIASGAPPAAGLITGIIGGLVAGGLAGCPLQVSGPAAGLAVLVYEIIQKHGFAALAPIVVIAGLLQIAAGALKVGQFFRAIAPAVVYGMLAGIGILIMGAQFHVMVDDKPRSNGLANLISIPESIQKGIFPIDGSSHHLAAALGITTILVLIGWAKFAPKKISWVPGALVAVALATAAARILSLPVKYVDIPDNLLGEITLPSWNALVASFSPEILVLGLTIAFVASAETLLSATAVDQMHDGPRANYDKELLAQGAGNMLAGLLGGLPMTGVIVRSATNVAAGARTRASAMMHGFWLLAMVAALPFVLRAVPTASLAAVLVYTGYKLVNVQNIRRLMQYGAFPVAIYAATVIVIVSTDLLTGILVGIGLSVVKILYGLTHMHIRVARDTTRNRIDVHVVGAATFLRMPKLVDTLDALPQGVEVHVHLQAVSYVDHACMEALSNWERQRTGKDSKVVVEWDELRAKYQERHGWGGAALTTLDPKTVGAASH
jgi:MFS superfamily sulfate permease-like transporter